MQDHSPRWWGGSSALALGEHWIRTAMLTNYGIALPPRMSRCLSLQSHLLSRNLSASSASTPENCIHINGWAALWPGLDPILAPICLADWPGRAPAGLEVALMVGRSL